MIGPFDPRRQGDLGEISAISWLATRGARVWIPLGHSPDADLVAELDGALVRVQVKTSSFWYRGRYEVMLSTKGGNRSWSGVARRFHPSRCDYLFVAVANGRRWFIPAESIEGTSAIRLGGPKYASFEVEPGCPLDEDQGLESAHSGGAPELESRTRL